MEEFLFVYGTLKNPAKRKKLLAREVTGDDDILEGFTLGSIAVDGEQFPLAVPLAEGHLEGLVIKVTKEELETLDQYQTNAYQRKKVFLKSRKEAWVYLAREH